MTLEQFKRHLDRRFDRLQRTKADKADLKRFVTKSQVRRLRNQLTRELGRYATKADLDERFTTKEETRRLSAETFRRLDSVSDKLNSILRRLEDVVKTHGDALREHDLRLTDLEHRAGP